jgi:hypothetical protein
MSWVFTFYSFLFQTACIGRKSGVCEKLFINYGRAFDAGCSHQKEWATGVTRRAGINKAKENGDESFQTYGT